MSEDPALSSFRMISIVVGVGHTKKECAAMVEPPPRLLPSCVYCVETHPEQAQTHHARDCPHPRPQTRPPKKACKTCQSEEHLAADCPDRVIFTCRVCGSEDHKAAECPNKEVRTCHNCGSPDHISKECDAPRKERDLSGVTCYNCNETGHSRRECPHPFDYTKIRCRNCGAGKYFPNLFLPVISDLFRWSFCWSMSSATKTSRTQGGRNGGRNGGYVDGSSGTTGANCFGWR